MSMAAMASVRYIVRGAVQGVGFRPFVYREAIACGLRGWVKNTPDGVEVFVAGPRDNIDRFENQLRHHPPPRAHDVSIEMQPTDAHPVPPDFQIHPSSAGGSHRAYILPDIATCPDCLREINDATNRRYRYPFTNCTNCGPRYSIIRGLPYDRARTTMRDFAMCAACQAEFNNPADRRFHAQPNACPDCGPQLALVDDAGNILAKHDEALRTAAAHIRDGRIVAVKGIGGFHLLCDAMNEYAARELRQRKHREEKPFAVMVSGIDMAHELAFINDVENAWLNDPAAPIVLLRRKPSSLAASIAPENPYLGLLMPYAPIHHLLMQELGQPVVATSGNISEQPICIDEEQAREQLRGIAGVFLVHNRMIAHPVDDSVVRIVLGQPLMLRAGRGLAPISITAPLTKATVLGLGPHMKATVAMRHHNSIVVGPHIGDIVNVDAEAALHASAGILRELHGATPSIIACDCHPDYASTRLAEHMSTAPVRVQHHHAHVLAVMAEHKLDGPVLGVAWDGTGYGDDGTIWGGEFLRVDKNGYQRWAHLRTFPLPGGDVAAREPRRSALGVLHALNRPSDQLPFSTGERTLLDDAMRKGINTIMTSSAGRLFDAAAAIVGVCSMSRYEGHAAMRLQFLAERVREPVIGYAVNATSGAVDWAPIIHGICEDLRREQPAHIIAARFHQSMVDLISGVVATAPDVPVVLCGGCFQNAWLLEHTVRRLQSQGRQVYWPHMLPPNDGAIAAGQVYGVFE